MEYGAEVMPRFNPLNACGYHIRDAGLDRGARRSALTIAAALCYLERARERGIDPDRLAPRVSFFWDVHNDFLEEVAEAPRRAPAVGAADARAPALHATRARG